MDSTRANEVYKSSDDPRALFFLVRGLYVSMTRVDWYGGVGRPCIRRLGLSLGGQRLLYPLLPRARVTDEYGQD